MTRKLYLFPDAPTQSRARIVSIDSSGPKPVVKLDQTVFHVKGGGQLADLGFIGKSRVCDVRHSSDGTADHFVDSIDDLFVGLDVDLAVDVEARLRNSLLHTAGHLIAGVLNPSFPSLMAVGAHHYPGECRVEFSATTISVDALREHLPNLLEQAINENLSIRVAGDPESSRTIAIGDYPPIPCGGTHIKETADLHEVEVCGIRFKNGRLRISYAMGSVI